MPEVSPEHWKELAAHVASGHRWLVAMDVVQPAVAQAKLLRELGATDVFALGAGMGVGALDDSVRTLCLDIKAKGMMNAIRASEAALDRVDPQVIEAIDAWDPERRARVFRVFFSKANPVAARKTYGVRPSAWQALEDKTTIDALWGEAGVPHAPYCVFEPTPAGFQQGMQLDEGAGVVFSGDSREGFNGGASYVRWVQRPEHLEAAQSFFGEHCDHVRAMPFLEGLPCSIHAFVTASGIAVFRPCEMLVFRRPGQSSFQYASVATFWDAPRVVAAEMRGLARRVALHLQTSLGYRGVFTIDGVLTVRGFLPTELNPRIGAGIGTLFTGLDIPMQLLHFAAIEDEDLDWQIEALERLVMQNPRRQGRAGVVVPNETSPRSTGFNRVEGGFVEVEPPCADFEVELGASPGGGGYLRVIARDLEPGPAFGPVAVELLMYLDATWDLGIGPLEAAREPSGR